MRGPGPVVQQRPIPRNFGLDERVLREAEIGAQHFLTGPWFQQNGSGGVGSLCINPAPAGGQAAVPNAVVDGHVGYPDNHWNLLDGVAQQCADPSQNFGSALSGVTAESLLNDNDDEGHESPVFGQDAGTPLRAPKSSGSAASSPTNTQTTQPSSPQTRQSQPQGSPSRASEQPSSPQAAVPPSLPDFQVPQTWARIVKEPDTAAALAKKGNTDSANSKPKNSIIDCLLYMASKKTAPMADEPVPEELKKYHAAAENGFLNIQKAKYNRRGMRNDANVCYVNVVVQSMLPCSALMQLLSNCVSCDQDRPFYKCLVRLCKEFHAQAKKGTQHEALNVMALAPVMEILQGWQSLGAQQDAGEFLFYMLNGMHDECKWSLEDEKNKESPQNKEGAGDDWAQVGKNNRKVEVRSSGVQEDSPIQRIFGGVTQTSVRSKNSQADSVSYEQFNHLNLDIAPDSVNSIQGALEHLVSAETLNEGKQVKKMHFKVLPKVLILNLKRFTFNTETGCPQKVKKAIKFEEKLTFDRAWLADDVEPVEYQLTSVIMHHGDSANGGHYNAAVRYNNDWYMYDDALVRPMDVREVCHQHLTAYLLLYMSPEKVDIRP